jgi:methyl-accepting chemotaxis protein
VKGASDEMQNGVETITDSINLINNISTDTKQGMEDITIGIQELFKTVHIVTDAGSKNSEAVTQIGQLVNKFKTE